MPLPPRLVTLLAVLPAAPVLAQAAPVQSLYHPLQVDSGLVGNRATSPATVGLPQVVWSTVVTVPDAAWIRLVYGGVLLAGSGDRGGDGSFLRLTSLRDGRQQTQHLLHVGQWQDKSAYFNGDSVLVEILAHQGTGDSRLVLREAVAGPVDPRAPDTVCGPTDDRVPTNDPRVARLMPVGCTGWIIDDCNHCLLTAGHCTGGSLQVAQFNVPLSTSGGAPQHPPPGDQYAVDPAAVQTNGGQGTGDDWGYFGVFPNSTTGLTPFLAQGGTAFALAPPPPVAPGLDVRVTGDGATSAPVSPTWYLVQKTHVGPYADFTGATVQYATDTTGGNSGSPVILESTGAAIGIHTHGGCASAGGANLGTGTNHAGLQAALANPHGVCSCPGLTFAYPNGLPASLQPDGSTTVRVVVGAGANPPQPGTGMLHFDAGAGFQALAMAQVSPNVYDATFPPLACFANVRFWFSAQDTAAATFRDPRSAPATTHAAVVAQGLTVFRSHDFDTAPPGWTVQDTAVTAGAWARGTPAGGGTRGDPPADYDGSGQCWVTGLGVGDDLDGGPTVLTTETLDLSALADPRVGYARWMTLATQPDDLLLVQISENGGGSWTTIESVGNTAGWVVREWPVRSFATSLSQIVFRFSVADDPDDSVTEAAIDAFRIVDLRCAQATWAAFGAGCAGSAGVPLLVPTGVPSLGAVFPVVMQNVGQDLPAMVLGLDDTAWSGGALPAPLQPFGFGAGCSLLVRPDVAEVLANHGGAATWSLAIPSLPALAGLPFYQQGFVLGAVPGASAAGAGVVN
jgi:hypothetical protein